MGNTAGRKDLKSASDEGKFLKGVCGSKVCGLNPWENLEQESECELFSHYNLRSTLRQDIAKLLNSPAEMRRGQK